MRLNIMTSSVSRVCLRVLILLIALTATRDAGAITRFKVKGPADELRVLVHPNKITNLIFVHPVREFDRVRMARGFVAELRGAEILALSPPTATDRPWGNLRIGTKRYDLVVEIQGTRDPEQAHGAILIVHEDDEKVMQAAIEARARALAAEMTRGFATRIDELKTENESLRASLSEYAETVRLASRIHLEIEKEILSDMLPGPRSEPLPNDAADLGLVLEHVQWGMVARRRFAVFDFMNYGYEPYRVASFQMFDQHGRRDHVGAAVLDPDEERLPDGILAVVPARTRVRAIARVLDPEMVGASMTYVVTSADGRPPLREKTGVWDLTKILEDPPPPPPENVGKVTLSASIGYGLAWVPHGVKIGSVPLTGTDITSAIQYRLRLGRGMTANLDFEAELLYAKSGQAQFQDLPLDNGMPGDLTRTAHIFGLMTGIKLHFEASWYHLFAQGALGVQLTHFTDELLVGGVPSEDTELGIDTAWAAGIGIDVPLGALRLGASVNNMHNMRGDLSTLTGSAHLGVRW